MTWTLENRHAELNSDDWNLDFEVHRPEDGVRLIQRSPNRSRLIATLAIQPRPAEPVVVEDAYVRGDDLICRYAETKFRAFTVQVDVKKICTNNGDLGLDLWVSVQTDLLDAHPQVDVVLELNHATWTSFQMTDAASTESGVSVANAAKNAFDSPRQLIQAPYPPKNDLAKSTAVIVGTSSESSLAMALAVHPLDLREAEWIPDASLRACRTRLFSRFMEKGVIRRARLQCWSLPSHFDDHQIHANYHKLEASPLPLTT